MIVLCDMDGILADFDQRVTDLHFAKTGSLEVVSDWDHVFTDGTNQREYWSQPGFLRNLDLIEGSKAGLQAIMDLGHDVYILSSVGHAHGYSEKFHWLQEHFPNIKHRNMIFTRSKELVRGDVLIDDYHENVSKWKKNNPNGLTIGIDYAYNREYHGEFDVVVPKDEKGWSDIVETIKSRKS